MATVSTSRYLIDQARRRFMPTVNNIPGMGAVEKRLLAQEFKPKVLAEPLAGSGLKPVPGNAGLPLLGHSIEMFRGGPDFALHLYRKYGPVFFPTCGSWVLSTFWGRTPPRPCCPTRTKTSRRRAGTRFAVRSSTGA